MVYSSLSIFYFVFSLLLRQLDDYGSSDYCSKENPKNYYRFYADWNVACQDMDKETFVSGNFKIFER